MSIPLKKRTDFIKKIEVWTVPNFSSCLLAESKLEDSHPEFKAGFDNNFHHEFKAGFNDNDKWLVSVTLKTRPASRSKKSVSVKVDPVNPSEIKHPIYASVFAVGHYNYRFQVYSKIRQPDVNYNSEDYQDREHSMAYGLRIDQSPPYGSLYFLNGTLTLEIELTTYLDKDPCFPAHPDPVPCIYSYVPDSLLELYQTRNDNGDVIIKVQNNEFKIHKNVLETRCPVLNELIGDSNLLALEDIKPKVFEMVVEYLYTGYVLNTNDQLVDNAECLLEAGHRFKLESLKNICIRPLAEHYIVKDNLVDAKILAIRCKSETLNLYLWNLHTFNCNQKFRYSKENMPSDYELWRRGPILGGYLTYLGEEVKKRGFDPQDLLEEK
ncbi:GSCOCG00012856001-RA-CDS [Cotesia congregata]|nr:GSCOCG00012856001-RA-CDS [Cotesia congregata]